MPRQASASADPYRGKKIGKYEILTRLSVGGMAELFLAFTSGPGGFRKFVALKQILPDVKTEEFVKMFMDEARITAAFSHANIGQVFDLGEEEDELYIAMEFLPGQNLEQVMMAASHVQALPIGFAARVARDVCLGLHYAHHFTAPSGRKVQVVHRDLAPRNVMITYDGVVKVIDFGIAKAKGRIARTTVGMVKGTSGYMSPEQVRGQELDGRSDLFTAGILLHEMLCGQRLFDTTDEDAMMRNIANADIAPPRSLNPEVPEALNAVVLRALAKEPAKRFATGREMAKAIEAACRFELFDDEAVAELMQALFAEKRLKTLALLDYASRDDERVSEVVGALVQKETPVEEERTVRDDEDSDIGPTTPMVALPFQETPTRPPPAASRQQGQGGRAAQRKPSSANQQPASSAKGAKPSPPRPIPEVSSRKPPAALGDDTAPTQIGPPPAGKPPRPASPEPEAQEGARRPAKMGVFTLGPAEPPKPPEPRPEVPDEPSAVSEVSEVSRVSRVLKGLNPPARRGLWFIFFVVLAGLAVLFMPQTLRTRIGALFSSASEQLTPPPAPQPSPDQAAPAVVPGSEPPPDAYEPPPPAEGSAAPEEPPSKAVVAPPTPTLAPPQPKKPTPSTSSTDPAGVKPPTGTLKKPQGPGAPKAPTEAVTEESDSLEAPSELPKTPKAPRRSPVIQGKPEGKGEETPAEEETEPEEPSVGPAEVDPSIRPLEDTLPNSTEGEQ
jgi:serine/threonine protein kinase